MSLVTIPTRPAKATPAETMYSAREVSIVAPHAVARAISPSHVERSVNRLMMYLNMPVGACQKVNDLENMKFPRSHKNVVFSLQQM